jgi:hypothetical protein
MHVALAYAGFREVFDQFGFYVRNFFLHFCKLFLGLTHDLMVTKQ